LCICPDNNLASGKSTVKRAHIRLRPSLSRFAQVLRAGSANGSLRTGPSGAALEGKAVAR
jgi:hypothetical protein